jgi:hypothetical protein
MTKERAIVGAKRIGRLRGAAYAYRIDKTMEWTYGRCMPIGTTRYIYIEVPTVPDKCPLCGLELKDGKSFGGESVVSCEQGHYVYYITKGERP